MIEVLKQTMEALERSVATCFDQYAHQQVMSQPDHFINQAITSLHQAIAELESQEPVGWHLIEALYPQGERLDIRMGDGSILCNLLPQADGDLWWEGSGTGEKFIDPVYADVTHWRVHSDTHPPQRSESSGKPSAWVGLTDEEIDKAWRSVDYTVPWEQHRIDIAQALEAKLKEKNT